MSTTAVSIATGASSQTATTSAAAKTQIDKNAFLKLLITELQNQDPLNPMDGKDSIAQLAQFSSLEQMQQLNTSTASMSAFTLIGMGIEYTDSDGAAQSGTVTSVSMVSGEPKLDVGGAQVGLDQVTKVGP